MDFWSKYQNVIVPELNNHIDEGWEAINEIGPNCIETQVTKTKLKSPFGLFDLIMVIGTFGLWLIWVFIANVDAPELDALKPVKFKLELRKLQ